LLNRREKGRLSNEDYITAELVGPDGKHGNQRGEKGQTAKGLGLGRQTPAPEFWVTSQNS